MADKLGLSLLGSKLNNILDTKSASENDANAELSNLAQEILGAVYEKDVMGLKYLLVKFIDLSMKYKSGE